MGGLRKRWHGRNGRHGDGRNGSWTWGNGRKRGQWNWQWPGAAGAWAGPTFEAMMQGWMESSLASLEERHLVPQEITRTLMLRRKPLPPMRMHLLTAAQAAAQDAHSAAHAAAQAAQAAEEAFAAAGMPEGSGEEYLQRVGDFVAAALDPLGIDVQVDVETPGGQRTTVKPSAKTDKAEEEDKQDKAASPEAAKEGFASSSDDEEWTVLSDKKP